MDVPNQPECDELYVISDIHMGGEPGFQIFGQADRLGAFIEHISSIRPGERVTLVLNGDIVDSLAENIRGYVASVDAPAMMQRIYANFAPVWQAFKQFVRQPGRHLVFVTGNHDIELALPMVQYSIRHFIAGDDPALNGAISFATHGGGYACSVGRARVFCTHGNEVDSWNMVDYAKLGQLANALNAGRDIDHDDWTPNAGTRLVIDLMNPIKRKYPFVDLLKPETKMVTPILFVLQPSLVRQLSPSALTGIGIDKIRGQFEKRGLLSASAHLDEVTDPNTAADVALHELLGPNLSAYHDDEHTSFNENGLLLHAEAVIRGDVAANSIDEEGTLGWWGMAIDRLRGLNNQEALRRALLDWIQDDASFNLDDQDQTFCDVIARTDPSIDFVVTGHTHMRRAIPTDDGRIYYNSGTWIRLIRLTNDTLTESGFEQVFNALKSGTMKALDNARIDGKRLILDATTAVKISSTSDDGVIGQLLQIGDDQNNAVTLDVVPGSEYRLP